MTREYAIEIFKRLKENASNEMHPEIIESAQELFDMAIQALSQEPCDKCKYFDGNSCQHYDYEVGYTQGYVDASNRFSQEPCDDAISREDAIRKLRADTLFVCTGDKMQAISDIESLPPVTPSCDKCAMNGSGSKYCDNCGQKSGKWIVDGSGDCYLDTVKCHCSECGKKKKFPADYDHIKQELSISYGHPEFIDKFCPNCGCRMVETQESEE